MKRNLFIGIIIVLVIILAIFLFKGGESCSENNDCPSKFKCENSKCIPVGCVGEGEYTPGTISPDLLDHMATECCEGLDLLVWDTSIPGCEEALIGGGSLCTANCGDGICDTDNGEQECTCPEDCL